MVFKNWDNFFYFIFNGCEWDSNLCLSKAKTNDLLFMLPCLDIELKIKQAFLQFLDLKQKEKNPSSPVINSRANFDFLAAKSIRIILKKPTLSELKIHLCSLQLSTKNLPKFTQQVVIEPPAALQSNHHKISYLTFLFLACTFNKSDAAV